MEYHRDQSWGHFLYVNDMEESASYKLIQVSIRLVSGKHINSSGGQLVVSQQLADSQQVNCLPT